MRLLEPYFGTSRDLCTHNFFTSYILTKLLLQKNLMLLGTTRKHSREAPRSLNRKMEIYSSKFLFNHVNGICLVAYQAKKKNPVMLFSSSHEDNLVATNGKKTVMILDYNKRKRGVDIFD